MPEREKVQPPLRHISPRFNPRLFALVASIYRPYLRLALGIRRIEVKGIEILVEHYRLFQHGKIRLIIAFRHPHVDDGALMAWLLGGAVRNAARDEAKQAPAQRLPRRPFAHFVYDRGAPLWTGPFIGWLLPRTGAVSVFRGKIDSKGLEEIRSILLNAEQPLAIAPEGAVSYSERHAAPLETGIAHFAFWCVRDLRAATRNEDVVIVPLVPSYRHGKDVQKGLLRIAAYLERECGLRVSPDRPIPERLRVAAESLFQRTERFYKRFYPETSVSIDGHGVDSASPDTEERPGDRFLCAAGRRVEDITEAALSAAERYLALPSTGEPIARVRRIEQACWDRIYREDIEDIDSLAPLDRALADRIARETSLTMRHLQLTDITVYLSELEIPNEAAPDELAEVASNLAGMVARLKGGDISATPHMGSRSVTYRIGSPISVGSRWEAYRDNKQKAVAELMGTLQTEFQKLSDLAGSESEKRETAISRP